MTSWRRIEGPFLEKHYQYPESLRITKDLMITGFGFLFFALCKYFKLAKKIHRILCSWTRFIYWDWSLQTSSTNAEMQRHKYVASRISFSEAKITIFRHWCWLFLCTDSFLTMDTSIANVLLELHRYLNYAHQQESDLSIETNTSPHHKHVWNGTRYFFESLWFFWKCLFQNENARLSTSESEKFWCCMRTDFLNMLGLIRMVDDHWYILIMVSSCNNFYYICNGVLEGIQ